MIEVLAFVLLLHVLAWDARTLYRWMERQTEEVEARKAKAAEAEERRLRREARTAVPPVPGDHA